MAKRERPKITKTSYFVGEKPGINFISSGCTLLDCALGGGYAIGRIVNIVGDRSTAKTALAAEAMINFLLKYPEGAVRYCETEAAFDSSYAAAMGLQIDKVDFGDRSKPITTVEEFARDFDKFLDAQIKAKLPGIYVVDSLDALSDEAEMERDVGEASYGMAKAKMLSEFFRKTARRIEQSQVLLVVVSQVRENIGVTFGEKYRRAGGKALDFYASQIFWLSAVKPLKRTISKIERTYGVLILAKVKKNKVGLQFREASFAFIFGFGVDNVGASIGWLKDIGELTTEEAKNLIIEFGEMDDKDYKIEQQKLDQLVKEKWATVETSFLPTRSKYA
jgi:recombination protein RecA